MNGIISISEIITLCLKSLSDGGIRANKALRPLKNGEVMATVTRVNGTYYKAVVTNSKSKILQKGKFEAAIPMGVSIKKGNTLIFTPSDTKVWRANKKNEFVNKRYFNSLCIFIQYLISYRFPLYVFFLFHSQS